MATNTLLVRSNPLTRDEQCQIIEQSMSQLRLFKSNETFTIRSKKFPASVQL